MVVSNNNNNNRNNGNNGNGVKRKNDDRNKPNKKPKELVCWKCGKNGHSKRDCRVNLNKNGAGTSGDGNSGGGNNNVAPNNGQFSNYLNNSVKNYCSLIP